MQPGHVAVTQAGQLFVHFTSTLDHGNSLYLDPPFIQFKYNQKYNPTTILVPLKSRILSLVVRA